MVAQLVERATPGSDPCGGGPPLAGLVSVSIM